jgi:hypothetical protein
VTYIVQKKGEPRPREVARTISTNVYVPRGNTFSIHTESVIRKTSIVVQNVDVLFLWRGKGEVLLSFTSCNIHVFNTIT